MTVRRNVWLGCGLVAVLLLVAAVIGLRITPPGGTAQPPAEMRTAQRPAEMGPAPPAPNAPAPDAKAISPLPSFDVVTVDPQGQAVIAGRAAPGDRVKVLDDGRPIGEVTADARGEWVVVPEARITAGNRQLELEATGPDGGPARRSADVVALSINPSPSGQGAPSALAVLLPHDKSRPAQILQGPEAATGAGPLALDAAEYAAGDRLVLSGQADPGARVAVYAGAQLLGTAVADAAGKWQLNSSLQRPSAATELRLDQLGRDGAIAFRITLPLNSSGAAPDGDTYVVQRGNSLWLIARQVYGKGARYTAIRRANQELIPDPDRIYPGQQFKIPKSL
jgi:nucleoid-associated protein YgaU